MTIWFTTNRTQRSSLLNHAQTVQEIQIDVRAGLHLTILHYSPTEIVTEDEINNRNLKRWLGNVMSKRLTIIGEIPQSQGLMEKGTGRYTAFLGAKTRGKSKLPILYQMGDIWPIEAIKMTDLDQIITKMNLFV